MIMHRIAYALLLLALPAHAACLQWGHDQHGNSACVAIGNPAVAESGHSGSSFSTYTIPPGYLLAPPTVGVSPEARLGCAADEERVMRQDFSIGCAKDVRRQQWR
jgi:hypothetical protein